MLKISVIIPVYNAAQFLEKAVHSALEHPEVQEVLLLEDASKDDSLLICKKLEAENVKVKLFQHTDLGNHGAGASRNLGLEKATQDFIAFLDADDYYLANRFQAEKKIFETEKTEGVFGAIGTAFLSEKGKQEFREKFKNTELTTVNYPAQGEAVFSGLLGLNEKTFGTFFHLNALTVRRSSVLKNNLKFNPGLRVHQDSDFITRLAFHCHLESGIIDQAVAIRGVHDDNRITKIKAYSTKFYENNLLLHTSLYQWSTENSLKANCAEKIKLNYFSFKIAGLKGFAKYYEFIKVALQYPGFLKTRYRFHALNKHHD